MHVLQHLHVTNTSLRTLLEVNDALKSCNVWTYIDSTSWQLKQLAPLKTHFMGRVELHRIFC
jgi:hypothetical protein